MKRLALINLTLAVPVFAGTIALPPTHGAHEQADMAAFVAHML